MPHVWGGVGGMPPPAPAPVVLCGVGGLRFALHASPLHVDFDLLHVVLVVDTVTEGGERGERGGERG